MKKTNISSIFHPHWWPRYNSVKLYQGLGNYCQDSLAPGSPELNYLCYAKQYNNHDL